MSLNTHLQALLQEKTELTFVEFMQQALYAPNLGYYSSAQAKFGAHGDFITAPELTPLFAQTLANQCQEIFQNIPQPNILEFGAGTGRFCCDLLAQLEQLAALPEKYFIMELSAHLRQRQQALIQKELPHLLSRIEWLAKLPETSFNGIIIANEVLDAMPVHRFLMSEEGLLESHIRLNDENKLEEFFKPSNDERLIHHLNTHIPALKPPYLAEANLYINQWIESCADILNEGVILLIDYGFPVGEYYHPDRNSGTLMCHWQHQAHTNPLIHVGEQDITAHVDFTHVAEAALNANLEVRGYTNQASFLLANGLLNLLEALPENNDKINQQQAVKKLLNPNEMGELFKVIALTKNYDRPLSGFALYDKRTSL